MNRIIKKDDLAKFFETLKKEYEIIAPVKAGKIVKFEKISSFSEIVFDQQSDYSPKKWFLPQEETLFSYKNGKLEELFDETKRIIVLRPCDANAIAMLDRVMLDGEKDPYYAKRKNNTLLFVFKCTKPFAKCFCTSMNSYDTVNFDLKFIDLGDKYLVNVGKRASEFVKSKEFQQVFREGETKISCENVIINPNVLDFSVNDAVWSEFSEKCIFCDGCLYVCPTCTSFSIKDLPDNTLESGKRVRLWDFSCYRASSEKKEPELAKKNDKFKHRIYQKMKYSKERFGKKNCVGCGRCTIVCPKKIDIVKIMNKAARGSNEQI